MEVNEHLTEEYSNIGGAVKQILELIEVILLPMIHKSMFNTIGIKSPKGLLLHSPPGMGKTLLACTCANQTNAVFLKLTSPQLVQMFIGDGAKLIQDTFELTKEKIADGTLCRGIIFIGKLDAIGTKRFGGNQSGDREMLCTMLKLLSQLNGFSSNDMIKVISATNRPDVLESLTRRCSGLAALIARLSSPTPRRMRG
jgi:26S proteasome regulatory subunit T5